MISAMPAEGRRSASRVRVIVADDDPLARRVIRDSLHAAGITVIAQAADGREALELARYYRPDVVVMGYVMRGADGLEVARTLTREHPSIKVLLLSGDDDDDLAFVGLRAGAAGFLARTVAPESLPRAVNAAARGEAVVSRRLAMRLIEDLRRLRDDGAGLRPVRSPLSPREWEVLDLLCDGRSTEEVARQLVLSVETVRSHVKSILRKLHVASRREAVELTRRMRAQMVTSEGDGLHTRVG
jgi:two-component system, NarL family, response regulator LiaR